MPHSIFNGNLHLADGDDVAASVIPVKLYAAVEPSPVRFRLLHASDHTPVRQRLVHAETGEEVAREGVRKGLVLGEQMVVLSEAELDALEPEPSRELELLRFVDVGRLDLAWYARPYLLGPNGSEAEPAYFALARALADTGKQGLLRWTMRKKHYRGALRVVDGYLALITLRTPSEIVAARALPERSWPGLAEAELTMAGQLVQMLEADTHSSAYLDQFVDHYAEQVLALVEAKAAGRVTPLPAPRTKAATETSLAEVLAASLARLEQGGRAAHG